MGLFGAKHFNGSPVTIHLYVENADAVFEQAVRAGAKVTMPLADMFWGDRYGKVEDPFGHQWSIGTQIRDVSPRRCKRRWSKWAPDHSETSPSRSKRSTSASISCARVILFPTELSADISRAAPARAARPPEHSAGDSEADETAGDVPINHLRFVHPQIGAHEIEDDEQTRHPDQTARHANQIPARRRHARSDASCFWIASTGAS